MTSHGDAGEFNDVEGKVLNDGLLGVSFPGLLTFDVSGVAVAWILDNWISQTLIRFTNTHA